MKGKKEKKIIIIGLVILLLGILGGILYMGIRAYGRYSLMQGATVHEVANAETENAIETEKAEVDTKEQENSLVYNGKTYRYRKNLINVLCMGIDKEEIMSERDNDGNSIGQADAIFVMSFDFDEQQIRIIAIPRDTIVRLEIFDDHGNYMGSGDGQITLQYAYADGQEKSCDLMMQQISGVLGQIPIHGYAAVNLSCIPVINDAVGGVEITMDEDYTLFNRAFQKGSTVLLKGEQAMNYVQGRNIEIEGSAFTRISRQKQYLNAFIAQAKIAFQKDTMLPIMLLQELGENMLINLDAGEIAYLVSETASCSFSEEDMYILPGEIKMGKEYEEYYLKEDELKELLVQLFYEETVEEANP